MFEAEFSSWDDGNFTLNTNQVYVPNLELARLEFLNSMQAVNAIIKNTSDRKYTKTKTVSFIENDYYNMWRFEDLFFLKGNLITIIGFTDFNPDCRCQPYTTKTHERKGFSVSLNEFCDMSEQKNFDRHFGILGREALSTDPGYIRFMIEGYTKLERKNSNIYKITQLPKSSNLSLMLVDKITD